MALMRRCPVCGVIGHTCGPPHQGAPLDPMNAPRKEQGMGPLREYNVMVNGSPTTMLLSDADAARLGATLVPEPALPAVDHLPPGGEPEMKARRGAPNKARTVVPDKAL